MPVELVPVVVPEVTAPVDRDPVVEKRPVVEIALVVVALPVVVLGFHGSTFPG